MEEGRRLKKNAIRCKHCDDVIESKHRHDYRTCSCGAVIVDGGLAYQRIGWPSGDPFDHLEDLSEYEEEVE